MTKELFEVAGVKVYSDEECNPGEIVLYSYGRMYVNPCMESTLAEFLNRGRIVIKLAENQK